MGLAALPQVTAARALRIARVVVLELQGRLVLWVLVLLEHLSTAAATLLLLLLQAPMVAATVLLACLTAAPRTAAPRVGQEAAVTELAVEAAYKLLLVKLLAQATAMTLQAILPAWTAPAALPHKQPITTTMVVLPHLDLLLLVGSRAAAPQLLLQEARQTVLLLAMVLLQGPMERQGVQMEVEQGEATQALAMVLQEAMVHQALRAAVLGCLGPLAVAQGQGLALVLVLVIVWGQGLTLAGAASQGQELAVAKAVAQGQGQVLAVDQGPVLAQAAVTVSVQQARATSPTMVVVPQQVLMVAAVVPTMLLQCRTRQSLSHQQQPLLQVS